MTDTARRLRFLTRHNCPLCDSGMARVARWAPRLGFEVITVDIDADPALADRYRGRVPVLLSGDRVVAEGRMPGREVVAGLLRARLTVGSRHGGPPQARS